LFLSTGISSWIMASSISHVVPCSQPLCSSRHSPCHRRGKHDDGDNAATSPPVLFEACCPCGQTCYPACSGLPPITIDERASTMRPATACSHPWSAHLPLSPLPSPTLHPVPVPFRGLTVTIAHWTNRTCTKIVPHRHPLKPR
jgi:hypothetical protein